MFKKRILQFFVALVIMGLLKYGYEKIKQFQKAKQHEAYVATLVHTASPQVQILEDIIQVDYLNQTRTLSLYLPKHYHQDTVSYPVLYFLDGQSLFDEKILEGAEWQIDEVLDSIAAAGGPEAIVVGIYSAEDRLTEYKPFLSPHLPKEKVVTGVEHAEWIATDVKQWVDQTYRTKHEVDHTYIGGASLGGLMSYYMITTFPDIYGGAIVFSPSFWVNDKVYELDDQVTDFASKRIFLNAGEIEKPTVESVEKMYAILKDRGMTDDNLKMDVELDEGHWHMTWRKGFKKAFPWILGNQ